MHHLDVSFSFNNCRYAKTIPPNTCNINVPKQATSMIMVNKHDKFHDKFKAAKQTSQASHLRKKFAKHNAYHSQLTTNKNRRWTIATSDIIPQIKNVCFVNFAKRRSLVLPSSCDATRTARESPSWKSENDVSCFLFFGACAVCERNFWKIT